MYSCPARSHRLPYKNPVDDFALLEERVWFCRCMMIRERVKEVAALQSISRGARGSIEIEVSSHHCSRVRLVSLYVGENFAQLRAAQPVIAPALEMQVVRDYSAFPNFRFGNQRQPSSDPLLEGRDFRKEPVWLPEVRLLFEANDSAVRQRPAGQRDLTVIGGRRPRALRQFLELSTESIVHPQLLGDFLCN